MEAGFPGQRDEEAPRRRVSGDYLSRRMGLTLGRTRPAREASQRVGIATDWGRALNVPVQLPNLPIAPSPLATTVSSDSRPPDRLGAVALSF